MLEKWLHWPERHPRLWHVYSIVMIALDLFGLTLGCWNHDISFILLYVALGSLALYLVHHGHPGDDDDNENEEEDDPDFPTGDEVDKWLRNRSKQPV